jgi:hypothetical protein
MKTRLSWLEVVLLAAPFVALAIYWNDLPPRVPVHWNLSGQINGWAAKAPGMLIVPLTALGLTLLLRVLPWLDPKLQPTEGSEGRMTAILPIVRIASLVLLDHDLLRANRHLVRQGRRGGRILMNCLLFFFVVLGNYLGNLRPELLRRNSHPLDARESGDLAGDPSVGRAPDVFRGARSSHRPVFSESRRLRRALRRCDSRARGLGNLLLVAS